MAPSLLNSQVDDVLAALLVQARAGVLDLLTADDRLVQQIDLLVVLRAGHQGQVRVVVAGQHVLVVAAGGLELQRQDLDLLFGALAQLLLVGDALREIASLRLGRWPRRRAQGSGGGALRIRARRAASAADSGAGCCGCVRERVAAGLRAPGRRSRRGPPGAPAAAAAPGARCGGAPGGAPGWPAGGPPGGAPGRPARRAAAARLRRDHVDHRPDVQPRGLAEVAGLAAVVARHGDHEVVAVDDDLGPRDAEAVDAGRDDLLRLVERVRRGPRAVGRAGGQRDAGAALQVDAELRLGLLVAGQEDQEVYADQQHQEECQVARRVHRRRRRCHVSSVSSRFSSSAPQRVRAGAESPTGSR